MAEPNDDLRVRLARLCRSTRHRISRLTKGRPVRWHPTSLCETGSTTPFTEAGAWEFIACLIEDGVEIEVKILDKPPGKTGYVILIPGNYNDEIYIKLEIVDNMVFGRSFHASGE